MKGYYPSPEEQANYDLQQYHMAQTRPDGPTIRAEIEAHYGLQGYIPECVMAVLQRMASGESYQQAFMAETGPRPSHIYGTRGRWIPW